MIYAGICNFGRSDSEESSDSKSCKMIKIRRLASGQNSSFSHFSLKIYSFCL